MTFAGIPTAIEYSGISLLTKAAPPIIELFPIFTRQI